MVTWSISATRLRDPQLGSDLMPADLAGYNVYRGTTSGGAYIKVVIWTR